MLLETERLQIVPLTLDDAAFVLELLNTPTWLQFIGDRNVRTLEEARQYLQNGALKSYEQHGFGPYLVKTKVDGTPIGLCGFFKRDTLDDVDIGYGFLPDFAGKGYGYEAATTVLNYGFTTLKLPRITGIVLPDNRASIALLEKLGLHYEKTILFREDGLESLLFGLSLRSVAQ